MWKFFGIFCVYCMVIVGGRNVLVLCIYENGLCMRLVFRWMIWFSVCIFVLVWLVIVVGSVMLVNCCRVVFSVFCMVLLCGCDCYFENVVLLY